MYKKIVETLTIIMHYFMKDDYVVNVDLAGIDFSDESNFKDVDAVDVGEKAEALAEELGREDFDAYLNFKRSCRLCYIQAAQQIYERLEKVWRPFQRLDCFIPSNALSEEYHGQHQHLMTEMIRIFSRAAVHQDNEDTAERLQTEWRNLIVYHTYIQNLNSLIPEDGSIDGFWFNVMTEVKINNDLCCRCLAQFALNILSTPHSNAAPERKFSEERLTKTNLRNRLSLPLLESLMLISDMLRINGCFNDIKLPSAR